MVRKNKYRILFYKVKVKNKYRILNKSGSEPQLPGGGTHQTEGNRGPEVSEQQEDSVFVLSEPGSNCGR